MKIGKLDKRHNGHGKFKYYVNFSFNTLQKFVEVRNWCWQTWGPSAELDTLKKISNVAKWSWICDQYNTRIYLNGDTEYQWFVLKWK